MASTRVAVGVAIEAAGPPRGGQHRHRGDGGVECGRSERGSFEQRPTRPVAPHPDPTVLVDDRDGVEPGKRDVGNRRRVERCAAGNDTLGGVPELERAPADPEAGREGVERRERVGAVAGHDLGGVDADHRRASPAHRRDRGSGRESGDQPGRDDVGTAHPPTVQAGAPQALPGDPIARRAVGTMTAP